MPFKLFLDENTAAGLTPGLNGAQSGVNNADPGTQHPENNIGFPWMMDKASSWMAYRCWVECELDAGMALHKPLPQQSQPVDTLASIFTTDPTADTNTSGANFKSKGAYTDVVQRMATSTYIFRLRGMALRIGYRIPIPGLKSVAGVIPVPAAKQMVRDSEVVGNFSGVPLFYSEWDLWYYVTSPPKSENVPPPNMAAHIRGDAELPADDGIAVPISRPDFNAVAAMRQGPTGITANQQRR